MVFSVAVPRHYPQGPETQFLGQRRIQALSGEVGTQGTVTLENIVRPPRNVCPWPTSGTLSRASGDGQSHTLVFGPECGTAMLDGTAVQLPARCPPGAGRESSR
ncbi:hypothetical protein [Archangium sp.]|uniref:hypothetical protein n=1 Tax=Archangium sp. TaxID=1872627 RepID=UPI002D413566|nr:hypothetical protein [Archangium sp.]HYO56203.1 hypothetical protein [Archangium sp.]